MNEMISIWSSSFPSNVLRVWDISERECGNECFFDAENNRTNTWQKEGWYSECAVVFPLPLDFKMSNKVSRWRDNVNWKCCWMNGKKETQTGNGETMLLLLSYQNVERILWLLLRQRTKHFSAHDTVREILALVERIKTCQLSLKNEINKRNIACYDKFLSIRWNNRMGRKQISMEQHIYGNTHCWAANAIPIHTHTKSIHTRSTYTQNISTKMNKTLNFCSEVNATTNVSSSEQH